MMPPRDQLTAKEIRVATLVWEGLTNREIAKIIGTTASRKKLPAACVRQARGMEPAGTRTVRGKPRRGELGVNAGGCGNSRRS